MLYVVVSFDFGGSSDVKVHAATADLALARTTYEAVCADRALVELVHVPRDTALLGRDALTLFWGRGTEHNNNTGV